MHHLVESKSCQRGRPQAKTSWRSDHALQPTRVLPACPQQTESRSMKQLLKCRAQTQDKLAHNKQTVQFWEPPVGGNKTLSSTCIAVLKMCVHYDIVQRINKLILL